jgi:hypothetical protein
MSLDPYGLRRRSPNPNSPIPYSPALLSPYLPQPQEWTSAQARQRYHSDSLTPNTPTIRLVGPSSSASPSSYYAPPPARTQSDDRHIRSSSNPPSASLRRHGTDPSLYPSQGRYKQYESSGLLHQDRKDVPVPTLPLNIRRDSSRYSHPISRSPTTVPSTLPSLAASPTFPSGRSVVESLKSLRNPFGTRIPRPPSPTFSAKSDYSRRSYTSASSRSSTETLVAPFSKESLWRVYSGDALQGTGASVSMEKLLGSGVGGRITNKFPAKLHLDEGWTGYKVILLISVLSVSAAGH